MAANRDERTGRPASPPMLWPGRPRILAGRDDLAGGTWLAVNEHGVVAALTNRPGEGGFVPGRPSRGGLPLMACRCGTASDALAKLRTHLSAVRYNGFNLFLADATSAWVIQAPGLPEFQAVAPGVHVLANQGWNDLADEKVARARHLLEETGVASSGQELAQTIASLKAICRDHGRQADARSLCMHATGAGTVSSTILALSPQGLLERYEHVAGPPCQGEYRDVSCLPGR